MRQSAQSLQKTFPYLQAGIFPLAVTSRRVYCIGGKYMLIWKIARNGSDSFAFVWNECTFVTRAVTRKHYFIADTFGNQLFGIPAYIGEENSPRQSRRYLQFRLHWDFTRVRGFIQIIFKHYVLVELFSILFTKIWKRWIYHIKRK